MWREPTRLGNRWARTGQGGQANVNTGVVGFLENSCDLIGNTSPRTCIADSRIR